MNYLVFWANYLDSLSVSNFFPLTAPSMVSFKQINIDRPRANISLIEKCLKFSTSAVINEESFNCCTFPVVLLSCAIDYVWGKCARAVKWLQITSFFTYFSLKFFIGT